MSARPAAATLRPVLLDDRWRVLPKFRSVGAVEHCRKSRHPIRVRVVTAHGTWVAWYGRVVGGWMVAWLDDLDSPVQPLWCPGCKKTRRVDLGTDPAAVE